MDRVTTAGRARRLGRTAAVVLLLGAAVVAAAPAGHWSPPVDGDRPLPFWQPDVELGPGPQGQPPPRPAFPPLDAGPGWLRWVVLGAGLALLALLGWFLVRWLRRVVAPLLARSVPQAPDDAGTAPGAGRAAPGEPHLPTLADGLDRAGREVRRHRDPAEGVIAAWVLLEDAAERSGVVRHPASTPTEFTLAVLGRAPADRTATRSLLELYLRARFGGEAMTAADVDTAVAALGELQRGLAEARP